MTEINVFNAPKRARAVLGSYAAYLMGDANV